MEYAEVESTTIDSNIGIIETTTVQEEAFSDPIEISHDINIAIDDNNKDPLDLTSEIDERYDLAPCYVEIERCDKIWETMKLIKELQELPPDSSLNDEDHDNGDSLMNDEESNSSTQANSMIPYIKYQPVLGNGNTSLPNFQFSVKSTRALYQCHTCGRQYSHRSTLREHSERVHNIIIPSVRKVKPKTPDNLKSERKPGDSIDQHDEDDEDDNESNHESNSSVSSVASEDKERLLDSASDTQELETYPSGRPKTPAVCKYCNKILSDKYYLKVHETLIHGVTSNFPNGSGPMCIRKKKPATRTTYRCSECGKYFYLPEKLNEHIQIMHGMSYREAPQPPIRTAAARKQVATKKPTKSSALRQIEVASAPADSSSDAKLLRPKPAPVVPRRVMGMKKFKSCEACGKVYRNDTNWKVHLIKHHGIIPPHKPAARTRKYPPPINSPRLHTCKYCGRKFGWSTTLRNHVILTHIKDQISMQRPKVQKAPLVQPAPKAAARVSSSAPSKLKKPQIPSYPRVHSCDICGRSYTSHQSLSFHRANIHGIIAQHQRKSRSGDLSKPYKCSVCNERFTVEKYLRQHQLIFHGIRRPLQRPSTATEYVHTARSNRSVQRPVKLEEKRPQLATRSLREQQRLNYDEDTMNEKPLYKPVRAAGPSKSETSEGELEEGTVQCILCNRHCKRIKKHIVEFHKVRNPDILISQCKVSTVQPKEEYIKPPPVVIKKEPGLVQVKKEPGEQPVLPKRRRPLDSMMKRKAMAVPPPHLLFELVIKKVGGRKRKVYSCKLCEFLSYGYDTLKRHTKIQHADHQVPSPVPTPDPAITIKVEPNTGPIIQRRRSDSQLLTRKRRRESLGEREMQKRRLSSAFGGEFRLTRAVKRLKEELEHKCEMCEREFRNADILAAHKVSCKARLTFEAGMESNDTRESSDRDSGIGISITIKKKNDSYEIVSRDSSGERPSKRSQGADGYSDASSDTRNSGTFPATSKNDDVEDLDPQGEYEIVDAVQDPPPGQVLSLTDLCRRALGQTQRIRKPKLKTQPDSKRGFQCRVCKQYWLNVKARNTHCWKAHKVSANDQRSTLKAPSLRELCVSVLVANGDYEADKKVWYPCHVCNTVWPTPKSRQGHLNSHK